MRTTLDIPLSIAPMIDWSYSHFRVFMRLLAPHALIYTEMLTVGAIEHNPTRSFHHHPAEQPLALQLGGSDPGKLAECAKKAEALGYQEINLNLGCPSDRVQAGRFGACLMKESRLVIDCIQAMKKAVSIPVTAKTRLGVDELEGYPFFSQFAKELVYAGSDKLIIHARKAWLKGLNPKQNRTIPPLRYDYVYQLKEELPHVPIVINGQIKTIENVFEQLQRVDGVMIGRLACDNPYAIAEIHYSLTHAEPLRQRAEVLTDYLRYMEMQLEQDVPYSLLLKPIFNFANGLPFARKWKGLLAQAQKQKQFEFLLEAQMLF